MLYHCVNKERTSLTIVYSTVYSGSLQIKYQSSASVAFVRRIRRLPVNSPNKGPVTRKRFPFDDIIMTCHVFVTQLDHSSKLPMLSGVRPAVVVGANFLSGRIVRIVIKSRDVSSIFQSCVNIFVKWFTACIYHLHQPYHANSSHYTNCGWRGSYIWGWAMYWHWPHYRLELISINVIEMRYP